jgi:hypothetical protein
MRGRPLAEVLSVEDAGDQTIVEIRCSGDQDTVTIRSRWEERAGEGRPLIAEAAPTSCTAQAGSHVLRS